MSPTGTGVANYSIMPSGASYMKIGSITTGPDGNVWFTGCSSATGSGTSWTMLAGSVDATTGIVSYYPNTGLGLVPCSGTEGVPGRIIAGPDGAVWYSVRIHTTSPTIHKATYLFRINISTGATTQALSTSSGHLEINGLTTGPDGRIWFTNGAAGYYGQVFAYTVNGSGTLTVGDSYSTPGSHNGGIVSGPDGNLWIIAHSGLYKMTTGGVATHYWLSDFTSDSVVTDIYSMVSGPDNALWLTGRVSGGSGAKIIRFSTGGNSTSYASTSMGSFYSITTGPDGAIWFNGGGNSLGRLPVGPYFSAHSITSGYTSVGGITTAGGHLWYTQNDPTGFPSIGKMSSDGVNIANYSIMPSGASYMKISSITTGPDNNVWFVGCSSTIGSGNSWTMLAGSINASTGTITYYQNTALGLVPCNGSEGASGRIIAGPDGAVWYSAWVHTTNPTIHKTAYLFRVDISTGVTTKPLFTSSSYLSINGLTTGPDGRIWFTNGAAGYYNQVFAYTVSGGALGAGSSYSTPGSHGGKIVSGPDGNLWIAGVYSGLYKMTTSGVATYHWFSDSTTVVTGVYGIAVGSDNALWVAGQVSGGSGAKIVRFTTDGNSTSYSSTLAGNSYSITSGPDGAMWFGGGSSKLGRIGY